MQTIENLIIYLGSQMDFVWKKVTSRKFLLALAGASAAYINGQWEILQGVIIAYLAAEGLDDFIPSLKGVDFKKLFGKKDTVQTVPSVLPADNDLSDAASSDPSTRNQSAPDSNLNAAEGEHFAHSVVPIPFDKEAFMQQVEGKVINDYGTRNACTLFYEAQIVFNKWNFNNQSAWEDAKAFMLYLTGNAFKEVWGETFDGALVNIKNPDKKGCTYPSLDYKAMQYGLAHYSILLDYKRIKAL